jgi:hypothetical protein
MPCEINATFFEEEGRARAGRRDSGRGMRRCDYYFGYEGENILSWNEIQ